MPLQEHEFPTHQSWQLSLITSGFYIRWKPRIESFHAEKQSVLSPSGSRILRGIRISRVLVKSLTAQLPAPRVWAEQVWGAGSVSAFLVASRDAAAAGPGTTPGEPSLYQSALAHLLAFPAPLWNLSREGCVRNNRRKGEMWRHSRFPLSLLLISESEPGLKCGILFCPLHNCCKNYISKDATFKTPGEAPQLPATTHLSV